MNLKKLLKSSELGNCNKPLYALDEIKSVATKIHEVEPNYYWLALHSEEPLGAGWMSFAFFEFYSSEGNEDTNIRVSLVFHGEGPAGSLRECRHTYWGDENNGYVFYMPWKAIVKSWEILAQYYDGD